MRFVIPFSSFLSRRSLRSNLALFSRLDHLLLPLPPPCIDRDLNHSKADFTLTATAWIPTNLFDVFTYTPPPSQEDGETPSDEPSCFEISLDALLQCLNIFGNAGPAAGITSSIRSKRKFAGEVDPQTGGDLDAGGEDARGLTRNKGRTGMRMSWRGPGYDLEMLLSVAPSNLYPCAIC